MSPGAVNTRDPVLVLSSSIDMKSVQNETMEVVMGVGEVNLTDAGTNNTSTANTNEVRMIHRLINFAIIFMLKTKFYEKYLHNTSLYMVHTWL